MEAHVIFNFNSNNDDELSVPTGDSIMITNVNEHKYWYKATLYGKEGWVPKNYIAMREHNWYYGNLTRDEAEEILMREPNDGAFMIRDNESIPGDFIISIKLNNKVQHFALKRDLSGKYSLGIRKFGSLNRLVNDYRSTSVSSSEMIHLKDMVNTYNLARAIKDFGGKEPNEIKFQKGDLIIIHEEGEDRSNGELVSSDDPAGFFPNDYVEMIIKD